MQNRQSGAAHVPIMFFLILLVMFLGALGFGYVTQTKNSELIKSERTAKADLRALQLKELLFEHYVADVGKVIGKPGPYEGRAGADYGGASFEYAGAMNPKQLQEVMDKAATDSKISKATSLEGLLGGVVTKVNTLEQRVRDIELARDKAMTDKSQSDTQFTTTAREAADSVKDSQSGLEQNRSDFESAKTEKDRHIATLQASLNAKADELTTEKEQALAREKDLQGQIGLLKTQLSAMTEQKKLLKPPHVADGKVLVAENGVDKAFISLGRKDMLQTGTVFRMKSRNGEAVKGYCVVTKVEDERAEVRLYDFVDPIGDWARPGDRLYNDFYTPRVTRTIYLMGRFSAPYGKENLKNLLTRLGNRVVSRMAPGVDTVILGNDPVNEEGDGLRSVQESDEFKLANELRVEFTYLPQIADLIKL